MNKRLLLMFAVLYGFAGSVFAEVPAAVTSALTDSASDVKTIGGAVLAVLVVVAAFRYMRRAF